MTEGNGARSATRSTVCSGSEDREAADKTKAEIVTSTSRAYRGSLLLVDVDRVMLPNGKIAEREIVVHRGAVAIIAADNGKILLERQYRHAARKVLWEVPAGTREEGEAPEDCAIRELEEETGYKASAMKPLFKFYAAPGYSKEIIHVFLAEGIRHGQPNPKDDELVECSLVPLADALRMIEVNEIEDSKTIAALLYYACFFRKGVPPGPGGNAGNA